MRIEKTNTIATLQTENTAIDAALAECSSQIRGIVCAMNYTWLKGRAFDILLDRAKNLRGPAAQAHFIALETIRGANDTNLAALSSLPESSSGVLDTDECEVLIQDLHTQNQRLAIQESQALARPVLEDLGLSKRMAFYYRNLREANLGMISDLQAKIDAAHAYNQASAYFYTTAQTTVDDVVRKSTQSMFGYLQTGSWGDMSWSGNLDELYKKSVSNHLDRMNRESSKQQGVIAISQDGTKVFINGEEHDADSTDLALLRTIAAALAAGGFRAGEHYVLEASARSARDILSAVGITKAGTYTTVDGIVTFRNYQVADGAKRMTTRMNATNWEKYERPFAARNAANVLDEGAKLAKVFRFGAKAVPVVGASVEGGLAFFNEYNRYPFLPEDRRLCDALVEGAVAGGGSYAFSTAGDAFGMWAGLELSGNAVGGIIGGIAGSIFIGGVVWGTLNESVLHNNHQGDSPMDHLKDGFYDVMTGGSLSATEGGS